MNRYYIIIPADPTKTVTGCDKYWVLREPDDRYSITSYFEQCIEFFDKDEAEKAAVEVQYNVLFKHEHLIGDIMGPPKIIDEDELNVMNLMES